MMEPVDIDGDEADPAAAFAAAAGKQTADAAALHKPDLFPALPPLPSAAPAIAPQPPAVSVPQPQLSAATNGIAPPSPRASTASAIAHADPDTPLIHAPIRQLHQPAAAPTTAALSRHDTAAAAAAAVVPSLPAASTTTDLHLLFHSRLGWMCWKDHEPSLLALIERVCADVVAAAATAGPAPAWSFLHAAHPAGHDPHHHHHHHPQQPNAGHGAPQPRAMVRGSLVFTDSLDSFGVVVEVVEEAVAGVERWARSREAACEIDRIHGLSPAGRVTDTRLVRITRSLGSTASPTTTTTPTASTPAVAAVHSAAALAALTARARALLDCAAARRREADAVLAHWRHLRDAAAARADALQARIEGKPPRVRVLEEAVVARVLEEVEGLREW
ncbi:hypothetical protein DFJ73DRAFT_920789 [Zopfochytrium polystomum]|nr:hypothetical protein DFJ73DRAFT_920789 [Zopfochytrium polystomum]